MSDGADEGQRERLLTVAKVRPDREGAEVLFLESARIYRLLRDNPGYEDVMRQLGGAARSGRPVRVRFSQPNSEIIVAARGTRD